MNAKPVIRRLGAVGLAASLCLGGALAHADDTEVFFGRNPAAAGKSNILFVIDTSGSMGTVVSTRFLDYDPTRTYTGNCDPNRIYWTRDAPASPPNCATGTISATSTTSGSVPSTAFYCQSVRAALNTVGTAYGGLAGQWALASPTSSSTWTRLSNARSSAIECRTDQALVPPHGDGTLKLYAANGTAGPFTALASSRIPLTSWGTGNLDRNYTFYTGNFINFWYTARTVTNTRLSIVQEVMRDTLAGLSNVNAGLMRFDTSANGGMVLSPIEDLSTSLGTITAQVNGLTASGATPLSETLYEAALYFRGGNVDFGRTSLPVPSVASSRDPSDTAKYKTPAVSECNANFIVFLTDGLPNGDIGANAKIKALPGWNTTVTKPDCKPLVPVDGGTAGGNGESGMCFDDLAEYLFKRDQNAAAAGVQNVSLYTIGFGDGVAGSTLLADAARVGGGRYYTAGDNASLTSALQSIVAEIDVQSTSFTSPTISVNAFNRTRNLNDLFITMFESANRYHWPGNLKKYRLLDTGEIVGADKVAVVNPATGFFREEAMSFWGDGTTKDGSNVRAGGAANRLPDPASRLLYTDFATGDLTTTANTFADANATITLEMLGLNPASYASDADRAAARTQMINWVRGMDVDDEVGDAATRDVANGNTTESRRKMGDPLHAQPVSVIYGGTPVSPNIDDGVIFVATNDGYLHAIDPDSGDELWAFVPSELLSRMATLRADPTVLYKGYGIDGNLRVHKVDRNNDGIVDASAGDRVYLLFGMARGGTSYFNLDITDKTAPRLMWRLGTAQLPGVGQTWSTPVVTRVNVSGATQNADKLVAIFGGGYDVTQDNLDYNTDDIGNRIFMVDLVTGTLLWRAGPATDAGAQLQLTKMTNSIPADIRVIDLTNDGFADRMYAADTGARVWRFDITNGQPAASLVAGGVFASLGVADGNAGDVKQDARRFYYAPDVSIGRVQGRTFLNIALGSGYRGSPLDTQIRDRFYALRDFRPFTTLTQALYNSWTPITDATAELQNVTTENSPTIATNAVGWKMDLKTDASWAGEKVLAEARTFGGQVFFTTYTPNSATASCKVFPGSNRLYVVNAFTGGVPQNRDSKVMDLPSSGIASNVVFVFPSPDNPDAWDSNERWCTGTDCPQVPPPRCLVGLLDCGALPELDPVRTFWTQRSVDD